MSAWLTRHERRDGGKEDFEGALTEQGLVPRSWSNGPNDRYGWHEHEYHKVLYCVTGSITFHTHDGDFELHVGDRLDVAPRTSHAATVGPHGVECLEAEK